MTLLSTLLLLSGSAFVLIGGIGVLRMPNVYTRLHAASLTDTLGTLLIITGLVVQAGFTLAAVKLIAVAMFLLTTGPTATYALANAALLSGNMPQARRLGTPQK